MISGRLVRVPAAVSLLLLTLISCAELPKGGDVEGDIRNYTYQNKPRKLVFNTATTSDTAGNDLGFKVLFDAGQGGAAIASSDIPWRVPAACRAAFRAWLSKQPPALLPEADQEAFLRGGDCREKPKDTFVGVAISGGGNKSAVYSAEVLFELKRYGLTDSVDAVSSVSGGSFTAALYGISCDPGRDCETPGNEWRPRWDYASIRRQSETNYFLPFVGHRLRPDNIYKNWFQHHGADDDLAVIVGGRLLHENGREITFRDLNASRPNLILNSTNVTVSRPDFDRDSALPEDARRPLSDDDALHFSFTQQYFWRLLSDLDDYPLKEAIVSSAAFPLIIDRPSLRRYRLLDLEAFRNGRPPAKAPAYIALFDGGVHDNFGLTEFQWFIECRLGKPSAIANTSAKFYLSKCGAGTARRPAAALVMGINSSLIRSEGSSDIIPKQRGLDTYLLPIRISGVSDSVDMIMGASGEQRKQQLRRLMRDANPVPSAPGYRRYDNSNPMLTYGPYQYVDFDLEAAQVMYCHAEGQVDRAMLDRFGNYTGNPPNVHLINAATGGSDASRCESLKGVLQWNGDAGPKGRNLRLPTVRPDFCASATKCPELGPLLGNPKLMQRDGPSTDSPPDMAVVFFDPANTSGARLLHNSLLFDAVRDVPTDFKLDKHYAWLLRYTARWAVAHRMFDLCRDNGPLLKTLGKYRQACVDRLPDRELDDDVGSAAFMESGLS